MSLLPVTEFLPRDGLPRVCAKLAAVDEVRVAYLGGSITEADGWRVKTTAWMRAQHPQASIVEIHAAIGGTGSDLGVYRFAHDVLRHRPDLVFIEYAVNDSTASTHAIQQGVEGIVRQAWASDPAIDLCFVYTLKGDMLAELQCGRCPNSVLAMEQVAEHYRIPSINLAPEIIARVAAGSLVFQAKTVAERERAHAAGHLVFSEDDVHPLDAGHDLYAEVVTRNLARLTPAIVPGHPLPAPLVRDHLAAAKLLPLARATLSPGWRRLDPESKHLVRCFGHRVPSLYAAQVGATLRFTFRGTAVGLYDLLGPDCGQVRVRVDDGPVRVVPRFDAYCTYHRLAPLALASGLTDGLHQVEVTVDSTVLDKASILFPHNRPDLAQNPDKYAGITWYVGGILLLGELAT